MFVVHPVLLGALGFHWPCLYLGGRTPLRILHGGKVVCPAKIMDASLKLWPTAPPGSKETALDLETKGS